MPHHSEKRNLPYSPEILYAIVADVGRYPEFLPWILEADIIKKTDQGFLADLTVGYKFFQDTYRSEVILTPNERVDIRYIKGPFKHLENHWIFSPAASNNVAVEFFINFEFQSSLFQSMINAVFTDAVKKMITAFEERARVLSGQKLDRQEN
jgi:coenzyme Q-binding protein COQ10